MKKKMLYIALSLLIIFAFGYFIHTCKQVEIDERENIESVEEY